MLYSLDSNAVSDIQRESYHVLQHMEETIKNGDNIAICDIVYYEVVRGLRSAGAENKLKKFLQMYDRMVHLPLDIRAIEKATDIYGELHKGQQIEDNDIYIAAIAMVNNCTLVTANERHFSRISGLKYVNWRE